MKKIELTSFVTIVNYKKYGSEKIHILILSHRQYVTIEDIDNAIRVALKDELNEIKSCWY